MTDLPPPHPGYHRDEVTTTTTETEEIRLTPAATALAAVLLALGLGVLIPLIALLWQAAF